MIDVRVIYSHHSLTVLIFIMLKVLMHLWTVTFGMWFFERPHCTGGHEADGLMLTSVSNIQISFLVQLKVML